MRKVLSVFILLSLIFFCAINADAKNQQEDSNEKDKVKKSSKREEIKYTGFNAKIEPFVPPKNVLKMLEKPDKLLGADIIKEEKLPEVDLQGIIWAKGMPQAIINSNVMKVGEYIDEFEIKEIRRNGILLFLKGNEYFIKMMGYQSETKKKTKKRKR